MIQRLGKYRIIERIGRGGMGMVYKAHDPMLDRTVALKVISADGDVTDELRARFFREAQACARLNHPNVITVYDMGDEDGSLYIVMEFLEGEELRQLIAQRRNVPLEDKLSMMIEVCDGLDYAHKRGIVHRDIKPGNIYVMRDGHVKLLDFGIARISSAADGLTRTNVVMGTLRYMSPEQARGRVDHRSDIFSVGAVFYELLVYRHAFVGEQPMEILDRLRSEDPTPLAEVDPSIPPELSEIVARSLRKDPGERYPELLHMRVDLERVRRRLVEEGDRARARVLARMDEIRVLQRGLTEAVGRSFDDETVPLIDERMRVAGLLALERQCASKIEHLRQFAARAEALRPALEGAVATLAAGDAEGAVEVLERIVGELPDHANAAAALEQARGVLAARRAAEERARREAEERARREAEEKARREAEERARREAEERARQEALARARRAAEQELASLAGPRREAEQAEAPRHAAPEWAAAETAAAEARAALDCDLVAEGVERTRAAAHLYARAADLGREAQAAIERARAAAQAARARAAAAAARADAAGAVRHAREARERAIERSRQAEARVRAEDHEEALALYADAEREWDAVMVAATEGAAAEARRIEALIGAARAALAGGQWADSVGAADEVLALVAGHVEAAAVRQRALEAQEAERRERERVQGVLAQAQVALAARQYARCLEVLRDVGDLPAVMADLAVETERLHRAVERGLAEERAERERRAAERARREAEERARREAEERQRREAEERARREAGERARAEAARREAERQEALRREAEARARREAEQALAAVIPIRKQAEAAEAPRFAAPTWSEAEARVADARAALEAADAAQCLARSREALDLFRRAVETARAARLALERARVRAAEARKAGAAARERAERAGAAVYAAAEWGIAEETRERATAATTAEDYEQEERLFVEAAQWYESAATAAQEAAAEVARREAEVRARQEEAERREAEARRAQAERRAAEEWARKAEAERLEAVRREAERREAERREAERLEVERLEAERREAERREVERLEAERREAERREAERLEAERREAERLEAERREAERLEAERREAERREAAQREAERLEAERREAEARKVEAERREAEARKAEAERREAEARKAETERRAAEERARKAEAERLEAEARKAEAARLEAEARKAEAARRQAEEDARQVAERRAAEAKRAEAERRQAEERAQQAEAARREAEARKAEAARREAEERRQAAARRDAEERQQAEAVRREREARQAAAVVDEADEQTRLAHVVADGDEAETRVHYVTTPVVVPATQDTVVIVPPPTPRRRLAPIAAALAAGAALVIGGLTYWQNSGTETRSITQGGKKESGTSPDADAAEALRRQVVALRDELVSLGASKRPAFQAGIEHQRGAEAAAAERKWQVARDGYQKAFTAYNEAGTEFRELRERIGRLRDSTAEARRVADGADASRRAKAAWDKAVAHHRDGEAAFKDGDLDRAATALAAATAGFQEAARSAGVQAPDQAMKAAIAAGEEASAARRAAEGVGAPRLAQKTFAAARQKEDEGRRGLDQKDYDAAAARFREAKVEYTAALTEAEKSKEGARVAADQARARAKDARERALKADAETLARDLLAGATAKDGQGDKQFGAADYVAARRSFQEAADGYGSAERRAELLARDRAQADQIRARMNAEKQRSRPEAPEFSAGVAQERQGTQQYERLAFKDAGQSWKQAADLFAKGVPGASSGKGSGPGDQRAREEVRSLLNLYEQAFLTKDVALMIRIRPALKEGDVKRLFEQSRQYRVSLKVDQLDVAGDSAVVKGQREDNFVSKTGQSFKNETTFTFRLKRVAEGWIIDAVN